MCSFSEMLATTVTMSPNLRQKYTEFADVRFVSHISYALHDKG